jgi:hypothetical protein
MFGYLVPPATPRVAQRTKTCPTVDYRHDIIHFSAHAVSLDGGLTQRRVFDIHNMKRKIGQPDQIFPVVVN